jgi:DNA-binding NarL/FixJ family response regulator
MRQRTLAIAATVLAVLMAVPVFAQDRGEGPLDPAEPKSTTVQEIINRFAAKEKQFKLAREQGLVTGFVSNGNGTERVLEYLRPHIDLYKVDLKSFDDGHYRELGGRLQPILDTIAWLHGAGVWVEIVTLLIPGFNDSETELRGLTRFLAGVSTDIPWHVTAFHQDYRMTDSANTTPAMLQRARERWPGTAIVVITRRPNDPDVKRAFECGATAFLSWPASTEALRCAIASGARVARA